VRAGLRRAALAAALTGALVGTALAETRQIVLTNGEDLFGEVSDRGEVIEVVTPGGERRRFPRNDVAEIRTLSGRVVPLAEVPSRPPVAPPSATSSAAGGSPLTAPAPAAPPQEAASGDTGVAPWYFRQRWPLVAVGLSIGALFAAGALRGEHRGFFSAFRRVRVLILLLALAVLGIYAMDLQVERDARREWLRPLHVAVVLVELGDLTPSVERAFRDRARDAADLLAAERRRYLARSDAPFVFHVFGPVRGESRPRAPDEDAESGEAGLFDRMLYGIELRRFLGGLNDAARLDADRFDVRMYVFAQPAAPGHAARFVEGVGESGGELGMVDVDLDLTMVDTAWIAVAHETLHTVGATDKYTDSGRSAVPEGLADPARQPLYPQKHAEIMAGEIALSPDEGRLVDRLEDVRIGATTAREIGW
jgi:hypothetical protein